MKECNECEGQCSYEGVNCPKCNGTGEVELSDVELQRELDWDMQDELQRLNVKLYNRI